MMRDSGGVEAEPVRRQFGAVAEAYAVSAVHSDGPDLRALVAAANLSGGERVLDMGCGAGHTALATASLGAQVTAVDITPEMLAVAAAMAERRGLTITVRQADVSALPFEDGAFDLVTSRYSAHHYANPAQAIQEAARVLRPGGRLLLIDTVAPENPALDTFYNAAELLRDGSHVRNWRVSEWHRLFEGAGLRASTEFQMQLDLDGPSWVTRSQTPEPNVTALHTLFAAATPAARQAFALRDGTAWGWQIPVALLQGAKG